MGRSLSNEEEWARRCMSAVLGVDVTQHDDGTRPGMFDLNIAYTDRPHGAVEITAAADPESVELWNRMNGGGGRWIFPELVGGWIVFVHPHARARRLRQELPELLGELERRGINRLNALNWRNDPFLVQWARRLRVSSAGQSVVTDYPGSVYMSIQQSGERSGGWVADTGNGFTAWLNGWIIERSQADNLTKLVRSDVDERHLFIALPGFTTAPFTAADLLMRPNAPLPTDPPTLPAEITHVWAASTWNTGEGFRWSPDAGWERFDKQLGNQEPPVAV